MSADTISTIVIVAFFVCMAIGFIRGFFKGAIKSVVDMGAVFISAAVSLPLTKLLTRAMVNTTVLNKIVDVMLSSLPKSVSTYVSYVKGYLENESTAESVTEIAELITAIPTVFLSPILFIAVFSILFAILSIFATILKIIVCPRTKKVGLKIVGGVLGGFAYVIVFLVALVPVNGYSNLVNNVCEKSIEVVDQSTILSADKGNQDSEQGFISVNLGVDLEAPLNLASEYTESLTGNAVSKFSYILGGKAAFDALTTTKIDGIKINLEKEILGGVSLVDASLAFLETHPKNYSTKQSDAINKANDAISESEYLALLTSKLVSFVSNEYYQGNAVMGIEKPDLGERFNPTLDKVLRVLKDTDSNDIRKDLRTVSNIANGALDAEIIKDITAEQINIWDLIENTDLIELVFVELYKNTRTRNMIPYLTGAVTNYVYSMYDDINGTYTDPGEFDYTRYNEEQLAKEALYISTAIEEIYTFVIDAKLMEGFDPKTVIMDADFGTLGRGLECLRESVFTERIFKLLIHAVLHSEAITETGIVDKALIDSVVKSDADLEGMLVARQDVIKLAILIQEKENREEVKQLMDSVIEAILKGNDDTLDTILNKDNLTSLGMKEQDAESIESILGSMIDGAKDCEFESNEEKEEEIKKTETIIAAVGNTVLDKTNDNMFNKDGNDSTTDMTAQDFVDSVMDSKLTSSMIQNADKDQNGEVVEDPYNIQKELSASDKEEISNAINNSYSKEGLTDEEKATLEALANIFGVKIQ